MASKVLQDPSKPVSLKNRIPDAFKGAEIPPAFPAHLSPKQRTEAVSAEKAAEKAMTPAEELEALFPTEREVTVQVLKGRDEKGRKVREPLTIYVEEATLEEWAEVIKPLNPLIDQVEKTGTFDARTFVGQHHEAIVKALAATTGVDAKTLASLRTGDLLSVIDAVVQVNRGFFMVRLPVMWGSMAGLMANPQDGQTSSPNSTPTTSPTPLQ